MFPTQHSINMRHFTKMPLSLLATAALVVGAARAGEVPAVVVQLAESYAASRTDAEQMPPGRTLNDEYATWFFQGYTHPNGGIWTKSGIAKHAYTQGQSYWREHPDERDAVLAGYGYLRAEVEGVWSRAFEKSSFAPLNHGAEKWWLGSFGDVRWRELSPFEERKWKIMRINHPK